MGGSSKALFSGSPFVRWTIVSLAALTGVVLATDIPGRPLWDALALVGVECVLLLIALAIAWPARFHWAGRVLGAGLFLVYALYLVDELRTRPDGLEPSASRSTPSAWNALRGLLILGLPGLWYAVRGRFGFGDPEGPTKPPDAPPKS